MRAARALGRLTGTGPSMSRRQAPMAPEAAMATGFTFGGALASSSHFETASASLSAVLCSFSTTSAPADKRKSPQVERAIRIKNMQSRRAKWEATVGATDMAGGNRAREETQRRGSSVADDSRSKFNFSKTASERSAKPPRDSPRRRKDNNTASAYRPTPVWREPASRPRRHDAADGRPASRRASTPDLSNRALRFNAAIQLKELLSGFDKTSSEILEAYEKAEAIFSALKPITRRSPFIYRHMVRHAFLAGRGHRALQLVQQVRSSVGERRREGGRRKADFSLASAFLTLHNVPLLVFRVMQMRKDGVAPLLPIYSTVFSCLTVKRINKDENTVMVRSARALYDDFQELVDETRALEREHGREGAKSVAIERALAAHRGEQNGDTSLVTTDVAYRAYRHKAMEPLMDDPENIVQMMARYALFLTVAGLKEEAKAIDEEARAIAPTTYDAMCDSKKLGIKYAYLVRDNQSYDAVNRDLGLGGADTRKAGELSGGASGLTSKRERRAKEPQDHADPEAAPPAESSPSPPSSARSRRSRGDSVDADDDPDEKAWLRHGVRGKDGRERGRGLALTHRDLREMYLDDGDEKRA